jgi:hypothetical protein
VLGEDEAGRLVIALAVDPHVFERLMAFDGGVEDFEEGGDREPDDEPEGDGLG